MRELVPLRAIQDARARLDGYVRTTPLLASPDIDVGARLWLKAELFQRGGSFKARGAFNNALSLTDDERRRGLAAVSAGNHAIAVAGVGAALGVPVVTCMPATAVPAKVRAVRSLGAEVVLVEGDLMAAYAEVVATRGLTGIHPFISARTIAGAGTLGLEILYDLPDVDVVTVGVGGGGLISGVAAAIKQVRPACRVIGVEPEMSDVVARSARAGAPQELRGALTIADGLNAPITGDINLAHVDAFVDDLVTVTEDEMLHGLGLLVGVAKLAAEPAAAAGLAALCAGKVPVEPHEQVVHIVSGGNADLAVYARLTPP